MKRIFYFLILFIVFFSCDRDIQTDNNNPYLPNYSFEVILNMSFPQYSSLAFPSNAVYVNSAGAGIRGLIVFNAGSGNFLAYDAACPNQPLTDCSTMTINGINAKCPCDDAEYSLFTGLAAGKQYPMKAYRVQMIDATTIKVYN
jgi:nitrite reductase/ring-hydroxylating ferredoxin subunit